jgi:hypothetical protein
VGVELQFLELVKNRRHDENYLAACTPKGLIESARAIHNAFPSAKITHYDQGPYVLANVTWLALRAVFLGSGSHDGVFSDPIMLSSALFENTASARNMRGNYTEDPRLLYKSTRNIVAQVHEMMQPRQIQVPSFDTQVFAVLQSAIRIITGFPHTFEQSLYLYPQGTGFDAPRMKEVNVSPNKRQALVEKFPMLEEIFNRLERRDDRATSPAP